MPVTLPAAEIASVDASGTLPLTYSSLNFAAFASTRSPSTSNVTLRLSFLVAPVPVQVKWAGDTPIIIVDKFTMPGAGTYSARVMIFENTYSGTWTAGDHGGLLHGLIVKKPQP